MTEAYFPPNLIIDACEKTLYEIEDHRNRILVKLADERFRKWWWMFTKPTKLTLLEMSTNLPDGDREIAYMHRSEEENKILKMLNLSRGTAATDEDLRIQVSLDDFNIIYDHYEMRESK